MYKLIDKLNCKLGNHVYIPRYFKPIYKNDLGKRFNQPQHLGDFCCKCGKKK